MEVKVMRVFADSNVDFGGVWAEFEAQRRAFWAMVRQGANSSDQELAQLPAYNAFLQYGIHLHRSGGVEACRVLGLAFLQGHPEPRKAEATLDRFWSGLLPEGGLDPCLSRHSPEPQLRSGASARCNCPPPAASEKVAVSGLVNSKERHKLGVTPAEYQVGLSHVQIFLQGCVAVPGHHSGNHRRSRVRKAATKRMGAGSTAHLEIHAVCLYMPMHMQRRSPCPNFTPMITVPDAKLSSSGTTRARPSASPRISNCLEIA